MKMRFSTFLCLMIRAIIRAVWIAAFLAPTSMLSPRYSARAQTTDWVLQFDGSAEQVRLAPTTDIIGTGWETTKSVNLWLKPSNGNACDHPDLATCDSIFSDQPRSWGITIGGYSDTHFTVPDRIWIWNYDGVKDAIGIPYTQEEWVNIALVHNSGVLRAYKNGVLAGSLASGATQPFNANPLLYLGGITAGSSQILVYHGMIDEVHVWNVGLTQAEIIDQMYQATITDTLGLKAYYQMSNGEGTILTDDSQFNWSGTLLDGMPPDILPDGNHAEWVERNPFVIPDPPAAPSNLDVVAHAYSHVDQSWIDNAADEFSFEIERCTGMGCSNFSLLEIILDSPGLGSVSYEDPNVTIGETYCYRVRAANTGGESGYTNVDCATVPYPVFLPMFIRK